jgi:hypothetical protein
MAVALIASNDVRSSEAAPDEGAVVSQAAGDTAATPPAGQDAGAHRSARPTPRRDTPAAPKTLGDEPADETAEAGGAEPQLRIREGTELLNEPGYFRMTGDRIAFFTKAKDKEEEKRLIGLENLNLERVAQTIAQNPDDLEWRVTGLVTEFRGENYLLIRRAILESERFEQDVPF